MSSAEVGSEGAELAVVFEAAAAARAVNTRGSFHSFQDQDALSLPAEPPRSHGLGGDTVVMLDYILSQHLRSIDEAEKEMVWDKFVDK